ncbi:MAG: c-type cytochrome [Pseudomonadales bacterium]|nr:c-type cytochrome [Pseudomonadales bacterium]
MKFVERFSASAQIILWILTLAAVLAGCSPAPDSALPGSKREQTELADRLLRASPNVIAADPDLLAYMTATAEEAVAGHCASCHGANLQGQVGVPNLVDVDWLWEITGYEMTSVEPVMALQQTILYGVRNTACAEEIKQYGGCPDTRFSEMPGYGIDRFSPEQVDDLTAYVLSLSTPVEDDEAVARGRSLWPVCTECHGAEGYGDKSFGGPDLTDAVWLYGGEREQIHDVIFNGRRGYCPPWADVLPPASIKALAVYIYRQASRF